MENITKISFNQVTVNKTCVQTRKTTWNLHNLKWLPI